MQDGWGRSVSEDPKFRPYASRRDELSTEDGCVLWGSRVVILPQGRKHALRLLHEAHPGIVRIKAFARSYMWLPGMDREIELHVRECALCQNTRKMPPAAQIYPWSRAKRPWERVHVDHAGSFEGMLFVLIIDAYFKWVEVHITNSTASSTTIELLRKSFASLGLPHVLVSDNDTSFTSGEFAEFMRRNGIRHIRPSLYHPSSNGLAEHAKETLKEGLKRCTSGTLNTRLSRLLFSDRIKLHSSTGLSPSEMLWGRKLRSPFDRLQLDPERKTRLAADSQKTAHDSHAVD